MSPQTTVVIRFMHEMAITQSILDLAVSHAAAAGNPHVTDLHLVIGELSAYLDDSVQFYWDIISQNTVCAGAKLHFHRIPARLQCQECHTQYGLTQGALTLCPQCGHGPR